MFDAISIVADSIVKKYQYDKTIEAKIVSIAQKEKGIYKVEYENALFDAYSSDTQSYYENETVYVSVPQGDFSKQKHIIGRKIDLEKAPDRTFNFKMPFDNFVGLKDLTAESPYAFGKRGYNANYPGHGKTSEAYQDYEDTVAPYKQLLDGLERTYNLRVDTINEDVEALTAAVAEFTSYSTGYVIKEHPFGAESNYLQQICDSIEANDVSMVEDLVNNYKVVTSQIGDLPTFCGTEDRREMDAAIQAYKDRAMASLNDLYNTTKEEFLDQLQDAMNQYTNESYNHLWSWNNENHEILLESTLGIQFDVETLLGDYFPVSGDYGLRILITGIAKADENNPARTVTEEIIWTNQQMYGNTYAFYTPYPQQRILDVSGYIQLEHIDIFFYQDHNFRDYRHNPIAYLQEGQQMASGEPMLLPANIYYDNLRVLLGITTEECKTDKVLLYTYNNLTYGEDMYGSDQAENNTKELVLAWVHKIDDGAILVDRNEADIVSSAEQNRTLEYYNANIYWYHFKYDAPQDSSDLRYRYAGPNWEYLSEFDDKFKITVLPDFGEARERWKAIVVFNGVPFTSEPLEFTNFDSTIDEKKQDQTNEVVFRLLREKLDGEGNFVVQEDNNLSNFFVYDENNMCIKNDDNVRWADIDYYIQVWIRNDEYGTYAPLPLAIDTNNWDNNSIEIEWQCPTTNTMLEYFQPITNADLANAALAPTNDTMSESFIEAIKNCTRKFRIRDRWDMRYINNTVAAIVKRGGRTYKPQQEFLFGQSGNMGSKYTIHIVQDEPMAPCMVQGEFFKVRAVVLDDKNNPINSRHFVFSWKLLAPTIITAGRVDDIWGNWKEEFARINAGDSGADNIKDTIQGYIRNEYPPVFEVTVRGVDDYPLKTVQGFKLIDNSEINENYRISVPNKVEFKSDGKAPITITSNFEVYRIVDETSTQQLHPEWELNQMVLSARDEWNENNPPEYIGLKTTITADTEIATNDNPSVYYKQGDLDAGFSLTATGEINTLSDYRSIKNQIKNDYSNNNAGSSYEQQQEAYAQYNNRLIALNTVVNKLIPTYNSYALDPYSNYVGGQVVPWEWEDGLTENYYTTVGFTYGGIYFKQAIPFSKNVYSSSLLNTWNGSVTIDEDNGAVLAQMIAAGAKDSNNRFTGVMMGDWANYADNSLDTPGFYGFKYGDQVFGFKTDGTGFIGKSGKGRIEFDGNNSLISNSDKTCYINLDPVVYNADGFLNNYGGFSSYFLYSQVKKTSTASLIGEDELEESTFWTADYIHDPIHDYFIVDPNNGVLTSGGIVARYGKVGNWMISSQGLYQKHTAEVNHPEQNRYMYLGYPGNDINYSIIDEFLAYNEQQRQQALGSIKAEYAEKEFEYVGQFAKMIFEFDPMHYFNYGWPFKIYSDIIIDTLLEYSMVKNNFHYEDYDWDTIFENFEQPQFPAGHRYNYWLASQTFLRSIGVNPENYTAYEAGVGGVQTVIYRIPDTKFDELKTLIFTDEQVKLLGITKKYIKKYINPEEMLHKNWHAHYGFDANGNISSVLTNQVTGGIETSLAYLFGYVYENYVTDYDQTDNWGNYTKVKRDVSIYPITLNFLARASKNYQSLYRENTHVSGNNTYFGYYYDRDGYNTYNGYYGDHYRQREDQGKIVKPSDKWSIYATEVANLETDQMPSTHMYYSLSEEGYRYCLKYYTAYYEYHLDSYNRQLAECVAEGLSALSAEQYNQYLKQKALYEADLQKAINEINKMYDHRATFISTELNKSIEAYNASRDADKYAIFAGYTPTDKPLFSVNWRGYMTAREGRIGDTSPWYIGDRGLTQKNNSGTIFLGDPATVSGTLYTKIKDTDNNNVWIIPGPNGGSIALLKNGTDANDTLTRGALVYIEDASDATAPYIKSYGNFAIYAGDTEVKFGVRMDGTILATQGNIGGWVIGHSKLFSIPKDGYDDKHNKIIFDPVKNMLLFGGDDENTAATVIYGNGAIKLSAMATGSEGDLNIGTIELGGYWLQGITHSSALSIKTGAEDDPENYQQGTDSIDGFEFTYKYNHSYKDQEWGDSMLKVGGVSVDYEIPAVKEVSASFANNVHNLFSITDHSQDYGNNELGIKLTTGKLSGNSGNALIFYPVGASDATSLHSGLCRAILGTADNPWNLVANHISAGLIETKSIYAEDIFTNGKLLATQEWTMIWIEKLAAMIKDVAGAGSGSASGSFSATGGFAGSVKAAINGVWFCAGSTESTRKFQQGILMLPARQFQFGSGTGGGEGTSGDHDPGIVVNIDYKLTDMIHDIKFEEVGNDGTIKLTITGWHNTSRDATFNQAGTKFYRNNVLRWIKPDGAWTGSSQVERDDNTSIAPKWIMYTGGYNIEKVPISLQNDFQATLATLQLEVDLEKSWVDGYNAAVSQMQISLGSTSMSVRYPTATSSGGSTPYASVTGSIKDDSVDVTIRTAKSEYSASSHRAGSPGYYDAEGNYTAGSGCSYHASSYTAETVEEKTVWYNPTLEYTQG